MCQVCGVDSAGPFDGPRGVGVPPVHNSRGNDRGEFREVLRRRDAHPDAGPQLLPGAGATPASRENLGVRFARGLYRRQGEVGVVCA